MDIFWIEEQYKYKSSGIEFARKELNEGLLEHGLWDIIGGTIYSGISNIHYVVFARMVWVVG